MKQSRNELVNLIGKRVMKEFAKRLDVTPHQIMEHSKKQRISDIRNLYCKLRHDEHGVNYTATGREIGRSSATVNHGVRRINDLLSLKDEKIVKMWDMVKDISTSYAPPRTSTPLRGRLSTPISVPESTKPRVDQSRNPLYYPEPKEYSMSVAKESSLSVVEGNYKSNITSYDHTRVMDQTRKCQM